MANLIMVPQSRAPSTPKCKGHDPHRGLSFCWTEIRKSRRTHESVFCLQYPGHSSSSEAVPSMTGQAKRVMRCMTGEWPDFFCFQLRCKNLLLYSSEGKQISTPVETAAWYTSTS